MQCPHCNRKIHDKLMAKHLAGKGGRKSKRVLSAEDSDIMVQLRKLNQDKKAKGLPVYKITIEEFKKGKR